MSRAESIILKNTEGQASEMFGILEATPYGLSLIVEEGGRLVTVPWKSLDMDHIKAEYPKIFYAYIDTRELQKPILLKLGGLENILSFQEAISELYKGLEKTRYYPLPENVNYLFENDPDVMRFKDRDFSRYAKAMRDLRRELQSFLREIFPREAVIIDDEGNLHRKQRLDIVDYTKGETSLGIIVSYLSDTRHTVSRVGLDYLREISNFSEDFNSELTNVRQNIPNVTFHYGNADHMKLPVLIDESIKAVDHMLQAKSIHRGEQYKLGEFYNNVYGLAEKYQITYPRSKTLDIDIAEYPQLDFNE